jgi:predicted ArsR family transcriptional regulator
MEKNLELTSTQQKILETLEEYGTLERGTSNFEEDTLSGYTKIPRTTLFNNLKKLEKWSLVEHFKEEKENKGRGRSKILWKLKKEGREKDLEEIEIPEIEIPEIDIPIPLPTGEDS